MTSSKKKPIRILVADDHPVVREGLTAMIERQPDMTVVAEAADGREALQLFQQRRPDVVLMDLRMPGMGGVEATAAICQEFPGSRIVVLTTFHGDEEIYQALRAGARGYLLKDMFREELLDAIRAVHAGERRIPPAIAGQLAERIAGSELTAREIEILELIAKGKSNKTIGAALGITEGTVKGHVNSILSKLGVEHRTEAATTALQRGIIRLE